MSKSFTNQNIVCSRGLERSENKFIFKDDENNKMGIIGLDSLELEFVKELPNDISLSANDYPAILRDNIILHDPIAQELLFINSGTLPT